MASFLRDNDIEHCLTPYTNAVTLDYTDIEDMLETFDGIFNSIVNFTEEISSLRLYPLDLSDKDKKGTLHTTRGTTSVNCAEIDIRKTFYSTESYLIPNYYNNYADYKGYTTIKLYLPFIGNVDLDPNLIVGKYITITTSIDILSGTAKYDILSSDNYLTNIIESRYIDEDTFDNAIIVGSFEADITIDIPLGQSGFSDRMRNIALGAIKTVGSIALSGFGQPTVTTSEKTFSDKTFVNRKYNPRKNVMQPTNSVTVSGGTQKTVTKHHPRPMSVSEIISDSLDVVNNLNVSSNSDRSNSANSYLYNTRNFILTFYRPLFLFDENSNEYNDYKHLYGLPCGKTDYIGKFDGFTVISNLHIEGEDFALITEEECDILHEELTSSAGVILSDLNINPYFTTIYKGDYTIKETLEFEDIGETNYYFNFQAKLYNTDFRNFKGISISNGSMFFINMDDTVSKVYDYYENWNIIIQGDYIDTSISRNIIILKNQPVNKTTYNMFSYITG